MAINVTLGEVKTQEPKRFPKLMTANYSANDDTGIIVLFGSPGTGVVVRTVKSSSKHIGYYSTTFIMDCFTDYNEPITIQNA